MKTEEMKKKRGEKEKVKNLGSEKKKMKNKTKIVAIAEIAIVVCSVLLVALPAIAAEQNQEMQKVSANAITTASEDDYVLGVYGNANEDDTIDMRDLTYVKLIFFGKKPETELADAKYDGKINPLDFIQIKLIIVGKEKEITVVDSADRIVMVKKPIERIIPLGSGFDADAIRMLRAQDNIIGTSGYIAKKPVYFPDLSKLPSVGTWMTPDYEMILNLNPDLVSTWTSQVAKTNEKLPDSIAVVGLNFWVPADMKEEVMKLGYILGKRDEASYYIDDFHDKYIDLIKTRTGELSEEERPKVYWEKHKDYNTYGGESYLQQGIDIAGGRNIFADVKEARFYADPEEVVMRNPDIIIKYVSSVAPKAGYDVDDPSEAKALRDTIISRPELANVNAVKNGRVYIIDIGLNTGPGSPIAIAYSAKWFQPNLFSDLCPQAIHQEYLTEFIGLDYDLDKHGVFVYPEPS